MPRRAASGPVDMSGDCPVHGQCRAWRRFVKNNDERRCRQHRDVWERLYRPKEGVNRSRSRKLRQESLQRDGRMKHGVFEDAGSLFVGDDYKDPPVAGHRQGDTIKTSVVKHGKVGDGVYFSDATYESDPYVDQSTLEFMHRVAHRKGALETHRAFRYPGVASETERRAQEKQAFLAWVDCDTSKEELRKAIQDQHKDVAKIREVPLGPRNIVTTPSKKGTYGYMGTTLGKVDGQYRPCPYEQIERERREAFRENLRKRGERPAFCAASGSDSFFASSRRLPGYNAPSGTAGTAGGDGGDENKKPRRRPSSAPARRRGGGGEDEDDPNARPAFRPASAKRRPSAIGEYPTHMPDPFPEVRRRRKPASEEDGNAEPRKWVPPTVAKVRPTRSIAVHPFNLRLR